MSKFVAGFRQKAMYQKIGLIALFILSLAVILLCVLHFTRIFGDLNNIMQLLVAALFIDQTIIFWKENKILAVMELVVAVIFTAILIIGFIL